MNLYLDKNQILAIMKNQFVGEKNSPIEQQIISE